MDFTSQICTTEEQSERLLDLGLKKETADMYYFWVGGNEYRLKVDDDNNPLKYNMDKTYIPAWSLHRLIEMCPLIPNPLRFLAVTSFKTAYIRMNDEMDVCYADKGTYNNLINFIEWLIKEGYFNKEYLEK